MLPKSLPEEVSTIETAEKDGCSAEAEITGVATAVAPPIACSFRVRVQGRGEAEGEGESPGSGSGSGSVPRSGFGFRFRVIS